MIYLMPNVPALSTLAPSIGKLGLNTHDQEENSTNMAMCICDYAIHENVL